MQNSRMKRTHALKKGRPGIKAWRKKQHQQQGVSLQSGKRRHKSRNTLGPQKVVDHTTDQRVVYKMEQRVRLLHKNHDRRLREDKVHG